MIYYIVRNGRVARVVLRDREVGRYYYIILYIIILYVMIY